MEEKERRISVRNLTIERFIVTAEYCVWRPDSDLIHPQRLGLHEILGSDDKEASPWLEPAGGCWGRGGAYRAVSNMGAGQQRH